jgi:hypothetical protein
VADADPGTQRFAHEVLAVEQQQLWFIAAGDRSKTGDERVVTTRKPLHGPELKG